MRALLFTQLFLGERKGRYGLLSNKRARGSPVALKAFGRSPARISLKSVQAEPGSYILESVRAKPRFDHALISPPFCLGVDDRVFSHLRGGDYRYTTILFKTFCCYFVRDSGEAI